MNVFPVYPLFPIEPVRGFGPWLWDKDGNKYLDLYGGHAVISIGHCHPLYVRSVSDQLGKMGFYSNSVENSLQQELASRLGEASGYIDFDLFLCNSGAEANENAFKLASFHTGRKKIIAVKGAFHGRTSLAVGATDDKTIQAPINKSHDVVFVPMNNIESLIAEMSDDVAAVIVEGIQGVAGVHIPSEIFLKRLSVLCKTYGAVLIIDEIQSGYGRSGKFFAHQYAGIKADIVTTAKGMGNGFPIGGVLISPKFKAVKGMLGTTFGGSHLACAAGIAVLDTMKAEDLVSNARKTGEEFIGRLKEIGGIKEVRGRGLMIGIEFDFPVAELRNKLLFEHFIFTGVSGTNTIRLLPPLNITATELDIFIVALTQYLTISPDAKLNAKDSLISNH
jgi:acetylornithine/N-succinyldiaminopimelate aminotransferase